MTFKSLFTFRKAAVQAGQSDDAGMIVILMMALVFVPIVIAHAAVMWPASAGAASARPPTSRTARRSRPPSSGSAVGRPPPAVIGTGPAIPGAMADGPLQRRNPRSHGG